MLSLPTSRRHAAPPPTMLRRGLSVDIFKADGAEAPPPPSVAVDVPLPATLARVLSGMDKMGQSLEPDVALR